MKMEFGKIKIKEKYVKEGIEQKFCQIDEFIDSVKDSWRKVKENLLDILNNYTGKMEIAPRKQQIT